MKNTPAKSSPAAAAVDAELPDEILRLAELLAEIAAAEQTAADAACRDAAADR